MKELNIELLMWKQKPMDLNDFYKLSSEEMRYVLFMFCIDCGFNYLRYEQLKKIVQKIQFGFKIKNLYAFLYNENDTQKYLYNKELESKEYKEKEYKARRKLWQSELDGTPEDIRIFELGIKEIYTPQQYEVYLDFKQSYLDWKRSRDAI